MDIVVPCKWCHSIPLCIAHWNAGQKRASFLKCRLNTYSNYSEQMGIIVVKFIFTEIYDVLNPVLRKSTSVMLGTTVPKARRQPGTRRCLTSTLFAFVSSPQTAQCFHYRPALLASSFAWYFFILRKRCPRRVNLNCWCMSGRDK